MLERKPHPSGRPIKNNRVVGRPIWRVPDDGYVTPRLREDRNVTAIGFVHKFDGDEE